MKTLYVSDLDGTLLRSNQTLSEYTIKTIEKLVAGANCFSYATARSYYTSSVVAKGLDIEIPVIIYNGTMIIDNGDGSVIEGYFFDEEERALLNEMIEEDIYPIVYSYQDGKERFTYLPEHCSDGMKRFLQTRKDEREKVGETLADLTVGDIFHYTCIDEKEKLESFYERIKEKVPCVFYLDMYTKEYWLEIMPRGVSKANAIKRLKEMLECDKVVVFGDGKNDIPMFEIADEAYAVENAEEELKKLATGIIGANDEDGVAEYLEKRIK